MKYNVGIFKYKMKTLFIYQSENGYMEYYEVPINSVQKLSNEHVSGINSSDDNMYNEFVKKFVKKYRNKEYSIQYNDITSTMFKGVYIVKGEY